MEEFATRLRELLTGKAGVYLGPEELVKQPKLPHVIVVPTEEQITQPVSKLNAADALLLVDLNCRAETFEDARKLALLCWGFDLGFKKEASIRYGTDTWSNRAVRVAQLSVAIPAPIPREDIVLARVEFVGQHVRYDPLTFKEVSNDPNESNPGSVRGDFHEHADPTHRFDP